MLPEGDAGAVMEALYSRGPLAVSLDASHDSFRFYASGAPGEGPPSRAREASGETSLGLAAACQTELCVPSCMHCRTATSFTQLSRPAAGRWWAPVGASSPWQRDWQPRRTANAQQAPFSALACMPSAGEELVTQCIASDGQHSSSWECATSARHQYRRAPRQACTTSRPAPRRSSTTRSCWSATAPTRRPARTTGSSRRAGGPPAACADGRLCVDRVPCQLPAARKA
jgi:hypothetical protein